MKNWIFSLFPWLKGQADGNENVLGDPPKKTRINQVSPAAQKKDTGTIALKIPQSTLQSWIYDNNSLYENLIGIQIDFRNEDGFMDKMLVHRIFYNPNIATPPDSVFSKQEINSPFTNLLPIVSVQKVSSFIAEVLEDLEINGITNNYFFQVKDVGRNEENNDYYNFEFFPSDNPDVGAIFFPLSQIQPLIDCHDHVIISGCQLNFGSKLSHAPEDAGFKNYQGIYFTLKMEAIKDDWPAPTLTGNNTVNTTLNVRQGGDEENEDETGSDNNVEGPGIVIAPPCPPSWYAFTAVANEIIIQNPEIDAAYVRTMRNIWEAKISTLTTSNNNIQK